MRSFRRTGQLTIASAVLASFAATACKDEAPSAPEAARAEIKSNPAPTSQGPSALADYYTGAIPLPYSGSVNTDGIAFHLKQYGTGINGRFAIENTTNSNIALEGVTTGSGHAILGWNIGRGAAVVAITSSATNTKPALDVSSSGNAPAADIRQNGATTSPAVRISTLASSAGLLVNHKGSAGDLAVFQVAGQNQARIDREGRGYFNGGTKNSGADVAEAFAVEGAAADYEPGDVLAISTRSDRRVEKAGGRYSTRVIGVYATKPGVLLTERDVNASLDDLVPVGVVGVIPTKVTTENGAIRRGDLLVASSTRGHAMKGTRRSRMLGAVIGKALGEFSGPGAGMVQVLVNVK
jgi:trimeric autotransporter adhesin